MSSFSPWSQQMLRDYALGHRDSRNKLTHIVGIPAIVLAVFGLLAKLPLAGGLDMALLLWAGTSIFYLLHFRWFAVPFILLTYLVCSFAHFLDLKVLTALFATGWALQLVGHHAFERKAPSFLENLLHLLVGPFWLYLYALKILPGFGRQVDEELSEYSLH